MQEQVNSDTGGLTTRQASARSDITEGSSWRVALAATIVSCIAVGVGIVARGNTNAPLTDPLGLFGFVAALFGRSSDAVVLGGAHMAYVLGLATLSATLLLIFGRSASSGKDAFGVGALVGLANAVAAIPDAADKAGVMGVLLAVAAGVVELLVLGGLTVAVWRLERRLLR